MQNLLNDLKIVLEKDDRLIAEGQLLKNKIIEMALAMDAGLIRLLLTHAGIKKHFFTDVDGVLVFDKAKFQQFVSNKAFLPDSYTAFKNKIGLTADGQYLTDSKEVVLAWPYKDCVLEGGQTKEDAKRDEVFWNETLAPDQIDRLLAPKVLTNFKKYDKDGEHEVKGISQDDNLIIKGNNLLALHTLKSQYAGRVKLIYIDPPYNTENDSFRYNDTFNHSTWLSFMKNRLEAAKKLMRNDSFICVHIDDNESAYLKVLMDEIYGHENFMNTISVRDSHPSGLKLTSKNKTIIKTKSHILVYCKQKPTKINPQYISRDEWDTHFNLFVDIDSPKLSKISLAKYIVEQGIVDDMFNLDETALKNKKFREFAFKNRDKIFQSTKEIPEDAKKASLKVKDTVIEYPTNEDGREFALNGRRLSPLSKSIWNVGTDTHTIEDFAKLACDFWDDIDFNNTQNEGDVNLPNGKKPERLLTRIISMFTEPSDWVLDFFAGSGTTPAVAHKLNRKYIGIEQLDYQENGALNRLKNVINSDATGISKSINWQGGGSFVYCELAQANQAYVDRIQSAKTTKDLQEIWAEMQDKAFLSYRIDPKTIDLKGQDFNSLNLDDQKRFLIEVMDKNMLYVPFSEMEDKTYSISESDKKLNRQFQGKA